MLENIFVGIMVVVVVGAVIYGWRQENGSDSADKANHQRQDIDEDEII